MYQTTRIPFTLSHCSHAHFPEHRAICLFIYLLYVSLDFIPFHSRPLVLSLSLIQLQADECHLSSSFTSLTQSFNLLFSPLFPSCTVHSALPTSYLLFPPCLYALSFQSVSHTAVLPSSRPLVFHPRFLHHLCPSLSRSNTTLFL